MKITKHCSKVWGR